MGGGSRLSPPLNSSVSGSGGRQRERRAVACGKCGQFEKCRRKAIATFRGNKKREEGKRGAEEKEGELSSSAF